MARVRAAGLTPAVRVRRWLIAVVGALAGLVALAVSAQAAAPSVTSVSPGSAINTGSVKLTFTGTGMDTATGAVLRRTGQTDIAGTSFTSVSATKASAVFDIASAAPGPWDVRISNPDGTGGCTGCFTVVASGPPAISGVTPDHAGQGAVDRVLTITGSHFARGDTVTVSGAGVTVTSTSFVSSSRLTATITVDNAAATTARTVTVAHPSGYGSGSCAGCLTITPRPAATSATPNSGGQGATGLPVEIAGTNFADGATAVFSGTGITVTDLVREDATTLTATVTIAPDAPAGARTVTVTNPDGGRASCTNCFTATPGPKPGAASPATAGQGANAVDVTLTGSDLLGEGHFADGATVALSGTGITVNSTTFTPGPLPALPATLTVNVTLAPDAPIGARSITVTNPDGGRGVCAECFTVTAKPSVTSLSPNAGGQTASHQIVTITGRDFADKTSVAFSGTGITVHSLTRDNATRLTLDLSVATDAPTGARDVTVTNPDQGTTTCAGCYTINPKPDLTTVAPNQLGRSADQAPVVITGSGFSGTPAVAVGGTGVTVHSVQRDSATQLTALMSVASDAATGGRSMTVTNPDGGTVSCAGCLTVAVAPRVTSTAPPAAPNTGTAVIDVFGADFAPGAHVALRRDGQPDIPGTDVVVSSTKTLRATFDLAAVAPGPWQVRVTNPNHGTGVCSGCLTVAAAAPAVTSVSPDARSQGATSQVITVSGRNFARGAAITLSGNGITVGPTTFVDTERVTATISVAPGAATGARTLTVTNTDDQDGSCDCFTVTKRATATLAPPDRLTDPVVATFSRNVSGLTTSNFVLREQDRAATLTPKSLLCRDSDSRPTPCGGDSVRTAMLSLTAPLVPGQRYTASLNPAGDGARITDDGGAVLPATGTTFRASRVEQETSPRATARWGTVHARSAYGGSFVRDHFAGAQARFGFTGTAITWYTITGRDQGIANVTIDGITRTVNNYADTRRHRVARTVTGLPDGPHTIQITATGKKGAASGTGSYVSIDAMKPGTGSVITTPSLNHQWATASHPDTSGGRYARADQTGAAMSFVFRGTGIDWHTLLGPANGKAKIYLDGQLYRTVDTYRAATRIGRYTIQGLADKVHTIRVVVLGTHNPQSRGTTVTIDRFTVH